MKITLLARRLGGSGAPAGRPIRRLGLLTILMAGLALAVPSLAGADSATTLTVVGNGDLSDSGLVSTVIGPAFTEAYPQYTFKFVGTGPLAAATAAENGTLGASVLLIHDPVVESQFVAGGYSATASGQSLFTSDNVLVGPSADPAGAHLGAPNNIAQAFADVAAAGIAGKAEFVSRGGTAGTTFAEHQIWALVASSDLEPTGLDLCQLNAASGGGETPIKATTGVVNGGQCPNNGALPSASALPTWYAATGLTGATNLINANGCTGYRSGPSSCYAFTDDGTFDYLSSGTDSAGGITNLVVETSDDSATAPGGQYALVNDVHGYIVNPTTPHVAVNLTAGQLFLNLISSPVIQARIAGYLEASTGAKATPFAAAAAPVITTTSSLPARHVASKPITLAGTATNPEPGDPALAGVPIKLVRILPGAGTRVVKTTKANGTGGFGLRFEPTVSGVYAIRTPQFSQTEIPALGYADTFVGGSSTTRYVKVIGAVTGLRARSRRGRALVQGAVFPDSGHVNGRVTVFARPLGSGRDYRRLSVRRLSATAGRFAVAERLAPGRWQIKVTFADPGTISPARPRTTVVTVASRTS